MGETTGWMQQSVKLRRTKQIPSVSDRLESYEQPAGGLLPPEMFLPRTFGSVNLNPSENVTPDLMGLVTDYMTRWVYGVADSPGGSIRFHTEHIFRRAMQAVTFMDPADYDRAKRLAGQVQGLDDTSLKAALTLCGFERYFMAANPNVRPVEDAQPDADTLDNIRSLVHNNLAFIRSFCQEPVQFGVDFNGAYTKTIRSGEADVLASNGLFDFKCSKYNVMTEFFTLQLGIYWRMLLRRYDAKFGAYDALPYLGVFNPRYNTVWLVSTSDIPVSIIEILDRDVVGFAESRWDIASERVERGESGMDLY